MIGSLMQRQLARFANIEPREGKAVAAAFFLFFFVLGSYFMVRPVRETMGTILGRETVADLWLYTAVLSVAIVLVYSWLVAHVKRTVLLPCIYGSVSVVLIVIGATIGAGDPSRGLASFFYVWISVLNLMLVSVFWSFLLEMFSAEQSKRLFGFIAAGGTFGALAGPLTTSLFAQELGNAGILYVAAAGFAAAIGCQLFLLSVWNQRAESAGDRAARSRGVGGNPFAGITKVFSSPYLIGIATFVCLLSAANTVLYFEQLRIVEEMFPDKSRRTEVFANIDLAVQSLTVITQLFLTGRIAKHFGVKALLTALPILMVFGFLALAAFHVFAVLVVVYVVRRWGEYAFIRPGREMLFSTLDTETKYKAKSFIDVPVYRFADYVGAQAKTGIDALTASPTVSVLAGAALAALWAVNGAWLGRRHDAAASAEEAMNSAQPGDVRPPSV